MTLNLTNEKETSTNIQIVSCYLDNSFVKLIFRCALQNKLLLVQSSIEYSTEMEMTP